jgi:hypothetical protein
MLRITDDFKVLAAAFNAVEGYPRWFEGSVLWTDSIVGLGTIMKSVADSRSLGTPDKDIWEKLRGREIYGNGGGNRYFVKEGGRIFFSKFHGRAQVEKARQAGFDILE